MQTKFEKTTFANRLKSMLKVDFKRMFTMPLIYILTGVSLALPIIILVMTTMAGDTSAVDPTAGVETAAQGFTNVWQAIGSVSGAGMGMDLTAMCNINMLYFLVAVLVCVFVAGDFKSGYVKNLFAVRPKKADYVFSKTLVCFVGGAIMILMFFVGAMVGGTIAGLSFDTPAGAGGIVACMLAKIFIVPVFVSIFLAFSVTAKQRTWLSILLSFGVGMFLFMTIPMMTPLDANFLHVIMCLVGGGLFAVGLGAVSDVVLNKTNLV